MTTARALALTQLLIVGLGGPILALLARIEHKEIQPEILARAVQFISGHVLWLFAVPVLYAVIGTVLHEKIEVQRIRMLGIAICAVLLVGLGTLIGIYLL